MKTYLTDNKALWDSSYSQIMLTFTFSELTVIDTHFERTDALMLGHTSTVNMDTITLESCYLNKNQLQFFNSFVTLQNFVANNISGSFVIWSVFNTGQETTFNLTNMIYENSSAPLHLSTFSIYYSKNITARNCDPFLLFTLFQKSDDVILEDW